MFTIFSVLVLCLYTIVVSGYANEFSLADAQRYLVFSGAAYCTDQHVGKNTIDDWSCKACKTYPNCKAKSFHNAGSDGNGYVAYDPDANEIIVAFSGTNPLSIRDWLDDLDFIKEKYPYCDGCEVHKGFYDTYKAIQSEMKTYFNDFRSQYPTAKVTITGHSLGAALTAHCAADFTSMGVNISVPYAFGMPRVGTKVFSDWYSQTLIGTFRVSHNKDPVPHLPPEDFGFHHMPYEIFYERDYNKWKLCSFEGEDKNCADQFLVAADIPDHLNYMDFDFTTNYLSCEL